MDQPAPRSLLYNRGVAKPFNLDEDIMSESRVNYEESEPHTTRTTWEGADWMNNGTTFIGMDVHKKSITYTILSPDNLHGETKEFSNNETSLKRFIKRIKKQSPGDILCCYEAGPCGYHLQRRLNTAGLKCIVVAPSLVPVKAGECIKTDRRDSKKLAKYLRSGDLTEVHPPTQAEEAVRDLCRARDDARADLMRCRHRMTKMLLRKGIRFTEGKKHWTKTYMSWLKTLTFDDANEQTVFDSYLLAIEQIEERKKWLERQVEEASQNDAYRERVGWLRCLRGIDTITAMTILSELHDFRRFQSPRELMSYLGIVPSEYSSSERKQRGSITKAGNSHVRRILTEAAWNYRTRPRVPYHLRKRREGQPADVITIADKAQQRLYHKYMSMVVRKKPHNKVNTAVGRELVGFIWAILHTDRQAA